MIVVTVLVTTGAGATKAAEVWLVVAELDLLERELEDKDDDEEETRPPRPLELCLEERISERKCSSLT